MNAFKQALLSELNELKTVDCHSHTVHRNDYYNKGGFNLFTLMQYFTRDISTVTGIAYGPELFNCFKSEEEKWGFLESILEKAGNVSYWRHQIVVYKKLFGLTDDDITKENWKLINENIIRKSRDPGWYDLVTKETCSLETQVRNVLWFEEWDKEYFTGVLRMEPALELYSVKARERLESYAGFTIENIKRVKEALYKVVHSYAQKGAVGIKVAHAYTRTLHSIPVDESKAADSFNRALLGITLTDNEIKEFQDFIIFYLAELAQKLDLVFQIHTGVQSNWGNIPDSNPLLLIPLLKKFPKVKFDLFHAGYPYAREMGILGKHFPNVWLNMAWMYIVSMGASRQILNEWIDLVPGYRILGFGSDVLYPELIYGHLVMARSCVADVLSAKVENDFLSEKQALSLTRKMFRDNAIDLYKINVSRKE